MASKKAAKKPADAKPDASSRAYLVAAVVAAVLAVAFGAFAGGIVDLSAAAPKKEQPVVMERPPPVEKAPKKKKPKVEAKAAAAAAAAVKQPEEEDPAGRATEQQRRPKATNAGADARRDKSPNCGAWAAAGECETNPGFMLSDCAASCGGSEKKDSGSEKRGGGDGGAAAGQEGAHKELEAMWPTPVLSAELARAQAESDAQGAAHERTCVDRRDDCELLARRNLSGCGEAPVMLSDCRKTCRVCKYFNVVDEVVGACRDKHEQCANWAQMGEWCAGPGGVPKPRTASTPLVADGADRTRRTEGRRACCSRV